MMENMSNTVRVWVVKIENDEVDEDAAAELLGR